VSAVRLVAAVCCSVFVLVASGCPLESWHICEENPDDPYCTADGGIGVACSRESHCTQPTAPSCVDTGCAPCTGPEACTRFDGRPFCTEAFSCAECRTAEDCTGDAACVEGTCDGTCTADVDCEGHAAGERCDVTSGACVPCRPETEATDCGAKSCDPATHACGPHDRGSREACESCVSDSDCDDGRCVAMEYQDVARPGGYCLKVAGTCGEPFTVELENRPSLSSAELADYCGIDEDRASCEAVRALIDNWVCTADGACSPEEGDPAVTIPGGLCETVGVLENRCTYACSGAASECLPGAGSGSTCGVGTGSTNYCGG
jgi:hypothetical protein